jgi:hypothetical protein
VKLEDQLARLAELGLPLAAGRTMDEMLHSWPREDYEERPFDLVLFVLGNEVEAAPWGRVFCERAWSFDTECVYGPGVYVSIAKQLCRIAGQPVFADLRDHVDLDAQEAWIEYTVGGARRHWSIEVDDDWADMMVVSYVMDDLGGAGRQFYRRDNGQAMTFFHLDEDTAGEIKALAGRQIIAPFLAV